MWKSGRFGLASEGDDGSSTFLWIDRWEPEPPRLLLLAFAWGACVAALTALLVNSGAALRNPPTMGAYSASLNVGAAPLILMSEERAKSLGLTPMARVRAMAVAGVDPQLFSDRVSENFRELARRMNFS